MARRPTGPRSVERVTARLVVEARGAEVEDLWQALDAAGFVVEDIAGRNPAGAETGAAVGGAVGSVIPGVGTAIGAAVGAGLGALAEAFWPAAQPTDHTWDVLGVRMPGRYQAAEFYPRLADALLQAWEAAGRPRTWKVAAHGDSAAGPFVPVNPATGWPAADYNWYRNRDYVHAGSRILNTVAARIIRDAAGLALQVSGGQTLEAGDPGQAPTVVDIVTETEARRRLTTPPPAVPASQVEGSDGAAGAAGGVGVGTIIALAAVGGLAWRFLR